MSNVETEVVDRSKWKPGPWDGEPDRWEGEFDGLPALALRNQHSGNWCGYVAVPPGHPWHGKSDSGDLPGTEDGYASVHGGITYSGACHGRICHVPKPGEPDNVWWLGFDCHHAGDLAPYDLAFFGDRGLLIEGDQYRTLGYVQNECRRLAAQAVAASQLPQP